MKFVIAMDSFKGSMTSFEAGNAAAEGVRRVFPDAEICVRPLADGGEGTADALAAGMGGVMRSVTVTGPLGEAVSARYGVIGRTAVMEMSAASGLTLVPEKERDPMRTTTFGVGEMIKDAVSNGCRDIIIGIGGSATNDGGAGMLQALGFGLLGKDGQQIPFGARGLERISRITDENVLPELKECSFRIACDVVNPLCGENGCSAVFASQKGASPDDIKLMDKWLARFAELASEKYAGADPDAEGAGAAGGLGFAFTAFLGGKLERGADIVMRETGLEECLKDADIFITGEGKTDAQTAMGKAPAAAASIAKKYGCAVFAFAGSISENAADTENTDAYFPTVRGVCTLEEAMNTENAKRDLADAVGQAMRVLRAGARLRER